MSSMQVRQSNPLTEDDRALLNTHIPPDIHDKGMLVPREWCGAASELPEIHDYHRWIKDLPGKVYCYLFALTPAHQSFNLPKGFDAYVVSFHLEATDWNWVNEQARTLDAPIILLTDGNFYDWPIPPNVKCGTWIYWHRQIDQIKRWYPVHRPRDIRFKTSAMCNRISQSKLLIVTALLEYHNRSDNLVRLNTWLELKNVHFWHPSNVPEIDELTRIFREKYLGQEIKIDDFISGRDNYQQVTGNPWIDALSCVAVNFTNESFHYSLMCSDGECHTMPGPFLTEKTMRCLAGGTPFVPVGQFDTYGSLERLGLKFDYLFDVSWDKDPGNLTRLCSIIDLIKQWRYIDAADIFEMAKESTQHNFEMIWSDEFFRRCEERNKATETEVLEWLKSQ